MDLNAWIAENILERHLVLLNGYYWWVDKNNIPIITDQEWEVDENISQAFRVVEAMKTYNLYLDLYNTPEGFTYAAFTTWGLGANKLFCYDKSPARAICLAAKRAKEDE